MKQLAVHFLLLSVLGVAAPATFAVEQCSLASTPLVAVHSLAELPPEVRGILGARRDGLEGIADRGGKFNATDVINPKLPMRRFSLAGVAQNCALVAVERGGRGYSVEVLLFERSANSWNIQTFASLKSAPRSLPELVSNAIK